jgi:hypothetical protein
LAGNKPLSGKRQRLRCRGRLGGRNGFHLLFIGPPGLELKLAPDLVLGQGLSGLRRQRRHHGG